MCVECVVNVKDWAWVLTIKVDTIFGFCSPKIVAGPQIQYTERPFLCEAVLILALEFTEGSFVQLEFPRHQQFVLRLRNTLSASDLGCKYQTIGEVGHGRAQPESVI